MAKLLVHEIHFVLKKCFTFLYVTFISIGFPLVSPILVLHLGPNIVVLLRNPSIGKIDKSPLQANRSLHYCVLSWPSYVFHFSISHRLD